MTFHKRSIRLRGVRVGSVPISSLTTGFGRENARAREELSAASLSYRPLGRA
jgi:hypothetical protein